MYDIREQIKWLVKQIKCIYYKIENIENNISFDTNLANSNLEIEFTDQDVVDNVGEPFFTRYVRGYEVGGFGKVVRLVFEDLKTFELKNIINFNVIDFEQLVFLSKLKMSLLKLTSNEHLLARHGDNRYAEIKESSEGVKISLAQTTNLQDVEHPDKIFESSIELQSYPDDSQIKVGSTFGGFKGVEYQADYSANYSNRSLVDKEYVDEKINEIPTLTSQLTNDGESGTSTYVETNELGASAFSNSYNDLQDLPTIPPAHKNIINKSMDLWSVGGTPNPMNDNWRGNNTTINAFNVDLGFNTTSGLLTSSAAQWQRIFANNTTSNYKLNSYFILNNTFGIMSDWEFCFVKGNSALQSSSRVIYFIGDFNQFTQYPTGLIDILPDEVIWMVIRYKGVASVNPSSVFGIAHFIFLEQ